MVWQWSLVNMAVLRAAGKPQIWKTTSCFSLVFSGSFTPRDCQQDRVCDVTRVKAVRSLADELTAFTRDWDNNANMMGAGYLFWESVRPHLLCATDPSVKLPFNRCHTDNVGAFLLLRLWPITFDALHGVGESGMSESVQWGEQSACWEGSEGEWETVAACIFMKHL